MGSTHSVRCTTQKETSAEVKAATGFLAGSAGHGRRTRWTFFSSTGGATRLFEAKRPHIELYAPWPRLATGG